MPATFKIPFLILVCKSAPWLQRTGGDVVELPGTDRTRITHGRYWLQPQLYTSEVQIPVLYHCTAHMVKSKTFYQYSTQACLGCKSKSWTLKIYFIIGCRTPHLFLLQSSRMQKHDSAVQSSVLYCSFFNHIKYNCTNHSRHPRKQTKSSNEKAGAWLTGSRLESHLMTPIITDWPETKNIHTLSPFLQIKDQITYLCPSPPPF